MSDADPRTHPQTVTTPGHGDPRTRPVPPDRPPRSDRAGIGAALGPPTGVGAPEATPRLVPEGMLGQGGNGRVYAMHDTDLDRPVAVKQLLDAEDPEAVSRFVEGARITAALEHPNVLPVHEIEITRDGAVFMTMKRITGATLGDALAHAQPAQRPPPLDTPSNLCGVFIGVCQALSLAHQRSVIHQDIKPDNIMLGAFGEVLLADWGSAVRLDREREPGRHLSGTPLYMSPEQAARDHADARSDVYCVGASLFHCLTLRPPTWDPDPDRFLALKRAGSIQPARTEELVAGAQPLLAIALKALAADPAQRYADAAALLQDLQRYQAGLSVSAWREPWWSRFRRWRGRNSRLLWSWLGAAAVVAVLLALLGSEWLARIERWSPATVEDPTLPTAHAHWLPVRGRFHVEDGRLVSTAESENQILLDRQLHTPLAITYDAEELPGCEPGDISLTWAHDRTLTADGHAVAALQEAYHMQVGAFDGAFTQITDPDNHTLACSSYRPGPGVHTIRIELQDTTVTLAVDGQERCRWRDAFPFTTGYIALRGTHPGKAFGSVRLQRREVPAQVPATAIGDAAARAGDDALAVAAYEAVVDAHPGTALAADARWKEGLCLWHAGAQARALAVWAPLRATSLEPLIASYDAELALRTQGPARALGPITAVVDRATSEEACARAGEVWRQGIEAAFAQQPLPADLVARYLAVHDRRLADAQALDPTAAGALLLLGRNQEVIDRYPYLRMNVVQALDAQDKPEVIIAQYPDQLVQYVTAAFHAGRWDIMDAHPLVSDALQEESWWQRGEPERTLAAPHPVIRGHALYVMGRLQELLQLATGPGDQVKALIALGQLDRARAAAPHDAFGQVLLAMATGDTDTPVPPSQSWAQSWQQLARTVRPLLAGDLTPARDALDHGDPGADMHAWPLALSVAAAMDVQAPQLHAVTHLTTAARTAHRWNAQQRVWYDCRYVLGEIDDAAYLAQPYRCGASARLLLVRGIRRLRAGAHAAARADLDAFAAAPVWLQSEYADALRTQVLHWLSVRIERSR